MPPVSSAANERSEHLTSGHARATLAAGTHTRLTSVGASLRHVPTDHERAPLAAFPRRRGDARRFHRGSRVAGAPSRPAVLDAVIVGGGPAGLSAALMLGRARKRVLVLDTGRPANAVSGAVGGLLAQGGVDPAELRRAGREQLADHPTVEVRDDAVLDAEPVEEGLAVRLAGRAALHTRALVLARAALRPAAAAGYRPIVGQVGLPLPVL